VDCTFLGQDKGSLPHSCEHGNESFDSVKGDQCLD
jgi:hypothetical protein